MLHFFSNNKPFVLALLPLLLIAHLIFELNFDYFQAGINSDTNITGYYFNTFQPWSNYLSLVLLLANAIFLNFIFNTHEFWVKSTYIPSFIYILLSFYFPHSVYLTGEVLAQSFILMILYQLYSLNQQDDARKKSFNMGLFTALAVVCNPLYLVVLPSVMISLKFIRPFVLREYILLLLGFILPFIYLLVFDIELSRNLFQLLDKFQFSSENLLLFIVSSITVGILLSFGIMGLLNRSKTSSIRFKKLRNITLSFILFIVLGVGLSIALGGSVYYSSMLIVPLAFILPYSYLSLRIKGLVEVLILTLLLISVAKFFIY
ncbi:hypothetical protein SAMN05216474_2765 [Lishizhenia tianjinensis]|uniref:EpsG family protein n=1 Tax=Lishizhenia tianjinensis TaxID=477690 RepID=A0A1I7BF34_9FLAO|nr:hypothetical protein [Lishizhenia tianjinensis]SFT85768.1 hypothetical protein SAMN05216474_2765 [Lishizhenia tianjinensis]